MLKEIVLELAILFGLVVCILWFLPFLMHPFRSSHPTAELLGFLAFLGFMGLLAYSTRHLKKLFGDRKTKHAISFTTTLIATIIVSFITFWMLWSQPVLM